MVYVNSNLVIVQQIRNTDDYPIRTQYMLPLKKGDTITFSDKTSVNSISVTLYAMY